MSYLCIVLCLIVLCVYTHVDTYTHIYVSAHIYTHTHSHTEYFTLSMAYHLKSRVAGLSPTYHFIFYGQHFFMS